MLMFVAVGATLLGTKGSEGAGSARIGTSSAGPREALE